MDHDFRLADRMDLSEALDAPARRRWLWRASRPAAAGARLCKQRSGRSCSWCSELRVERFQFIEDCIVDDLIGDAAPRKMTAQREMWAS